MSDKRKRIILPIVIIVVGIFGTFAMIKSRRPAPQREPIEYAPLVRVEVAQPTNRQLTVVANGTVRPRTETALVAEVAGRVISISRAFAAGGFFEKGDVLVTIDPRDYELAVVTAKGQVAQARVLAQLEAAQAEVAREEWERLGDGKPSPLATRELQVQEAQAALASAEAALERAQRNLDRARIRAPFAGRVREKRLDVGQYVTPGVAVASIFSVDYAEIRLPIPDRQLAFLDLPINYRGESEQRPGPLVTLSANFAGARHTWAGRIVRVEGEIDPVSRMVHVIAQVDNPYGRGPNGEERMPLAVGLFVEAEIMGDEAADVFVLPRAAVRSDNQVLIVDDDDRLRFREVTVLRLNRNEAIISEGLVAGERICVSSLEAVSDGMKVRTVPFLGDDATQPTEVRETADVGGQP